MYACVCKSLTEADIRREAIRVQFRRAALVRGLKLDDESCCGRCLSELDRLLATACPGGENPREPADRRAAREGTGQWRRSPAFLNASTISSRSS